MKSAVGSNMTLSGISKDVSQVHVIGCGSWSVNMMLQSSLRNYVKRGVATDNGAMFPPSDVGDMCGRVSSHEVCCAATVWSIFRSRGHTDARSELQCLTWNSF